MKRLTTAAALAAALTCVPAARADTCYDPNNRNFECDAQGTAPRSSEPETPAVGAPSVDATTPDVITPTIEATTPAVPAATVTSPTPAIAPRSPTVGVSVPQTQQPTVASPPDTAAVAAALANPQCMALLRSYVSAAQAGNGPASAAAYDALKQAGGCGVLGSAPLQPAAAASDPRFVPRGDRPMLDRSAAACAQQPAVCAQVVNQLRAGTSPEAAAALYSNAISVGLSLGTAMSSAMLPAPSIRAPGQTTDMRSLAPPPIRTTYGEGRPVNRPAPSSQSTITGLGQP